MKPIVLIILIVLAVPPVFLAQDPPAQKPPGPTVELRLIVTDKDRQPLSSISKDEIRISEDKVEQTVLSVERDDRPIDYGLLIDSSASLRRLIASAVEAAKMIVINRRGSDEIFIESFVSSNNIITLHDFSTDSNALLESLKLIRVEGGQSAVIDALYLGAQQVAEHNKTVANRRKALVIITDGEDRNSYYKTSALITLLREKGIQVFALGLVIDLNEKSDSFIRLSPRDKAEKLLNTITEETGGRVFYPRTGPELIKATAEIIVDLRSQFRVTYQSSSVKKGFRKVDVKLISPNGEQRNVITPRGYYADGQSKSKEQK